MDDKLRVITPENVPFEFELAGIAQRTCAWLLDLMVMGMATVGVGLVISFGAALAPGLAGAVFAIAFFLIQWWYSAISEWRFGGLTLGKRVVGIRTLQANGLRLTFVQAVIRNLIRIVDLLPALYFIGGVSAIVDGRGRRLGDLAAHTVVVRERRAAMPAAVLPAAQRYNTFLEDAAVVDAVRRITPPERDAMVAVSLRRENLPVDVRHDLFGQLARHLIERLGVDKPSFFSDEKYVLSLTALLLDPGRRSLPPAARSVRG